MRKKKMGGELVIGGIKPREDKQFGLYLTAIKQTDKSIFVIVIDT